MFTRLCDFIERQLIRLFIYIMLATILVTVTDDKMIISSINFVTGVIVGIIVRKRKFRK